MKIALRNTRIEDYPRIEALCRLVYPGTAPWAERQIISHLQIFPEGQFVAEDLDTGDIVGMSASLIITWDDYEVTGNWRDFTEAGMFTNHDPENGMTLYGAEIMVSPNYQGKGIGKLIYAEREKLVLAKGLLRIRAGARLRGYGTYAEELSPEDYTLKVVRGEVFDPTLSFQLKRGFDVVAVVSGYLGSDPESLGYAAVIEWLNEDVAKARNFVPRASKFRVPGPWSK